MKRCPFCGKKIESDASQCGHCGKTIGKRKSEAADQTRLTNIDTWKEKTIPSWVMFLVVALLLFCVWVMFSQATQSEPKTPPLDENSLRFKMDDEAYPMDDRTA